jgi:succinate dehydrogenase / fumarate reductase cytochrome b subunit
MSTLRFIWSSVGHKIVLALAGLALSLFLVVHLLGNLQIFSSDPHALDTYAHKLTSLGVLLIVAEVALAAVFLIHIVVAITVTLNNLTARPTRYKKVRNAGDPSRKTFSSRTMIVSGLTIFLFLILHLMHFKFAVFQGEHPTKVVDGVMLNDFSRMLIESFSNPWIAGGYVIALLWLGFHLRHGFWSAFQSLGIHHPRWTPVIHGIGIAFALLIGIGYLSIPIIIYFSDFSL